MNSNIYEGINNIYNFPKKLPYITVSAKGISNGLSSIINDGADFGPDSYLNTSSKNKIGPPYSQTSGIQEALNYAKSISSYLNDITGYVLPPIKLLTGIFTLNSNIIFPYFNDINNIPSFTILGEGTGIASPSQINMNGYNIIIGNQNGNQSFGSGFLLQGVQFYNSNNSNSSIELSGNYSFNSNCTLRDIGLYNVLFDMSNAQKIRQLNIDNIYSNSSFFSPNTTYQTTITKATFDNGLYPFVNQQLSALYLKSSLNLKTYAPVISINQWEIDNYGIINYTSQGQYTLSIIDINQLIVNSNKSFFNYASYSLGPLNLKIHINNLILNNLTDFSIPSNSYINIEELTINEITNNTTYELSSFNLPIFSSISGISGGTIYLRFINYSISYKKLIITIYNYENNTTTNQTINYPLPFNSYALITGNNTGLNISASTTGITITSPNNTTAYNGIVIIEGY